MSEHKCTLCNHYSKTDEQNERHEATDAHRIAALEAQNKKLVEALENSTQCLEAWKLYHSKFFDKADESAVVTARALLSEVTK